MSLKDIELKKHDKSPLKIIPKNYQEQAVKAFIKNDWNGIFEMATGTGKTITSLLCAQEYLKENNRIFLIIVVPFTHLINQWEETINRFSIKVTAKCSGNKKNWIYLLENRIRDFNIGIQKIECIITTYKTASSEDFINLINTIRGKSFLIADECHYFGTSSFQKRNFKNISVKLGLSATPDRWWDEQGTNFLKNYFGESVFNYSMQDAIANGALTEYDYYPVSVNLLNEEIEKYQQITKQLFYLSQEKPIDYEKIEILNRRRSLILSKAENKKIILKKLLSEKGAANVYNTLVYVAPGEVEEYLNIVNNLGIRSHRFDSKIPLKERENILKAFADKQIQLLVAIKCLDEGVDVPSTETAYFMASTTNPREFIQRRGRVLRTFPGKKYAQIFDFIVLPENSKDEIFRIIASKEFPRFAEFSSYCRNKYSARNKVREILKKYDLEHLMDKLPWEVYQEKKEEFDRSDSEF